MVYILVKHKVKDYEQFRKVFFGNLKEVKNNGSQGGYVFRNKDNPNEVFVLVKWDNLEHFKKFSQATDPEESKKKGGIIGEPEGLFFEEVEEFSGQSAFTSHHSVPEVIVPSFRSEQKLETALFLHVF